MLVIALEECGKETHSLSIHNERFLNIKEF